MRVLILIEGRADGQVEIVTATAEGTAQGVTGQEGAAAYVIHQVERALLVMGFNQDDKQGGHDGGKQHGSD